MNGPDFRYHLKSCVRERCSAAVWANASQHDCGRGLESGAESTIVRREHKKLLQDEDYAGAALLATVAAIARMGSVSDVAMSSNPRCIRRGLAQLIPTSPCDPAVRDSEFLVTGAEQADPRSAFYARWLPSIDASRGRIRPPRELAWSWGLHSASPE
eukprot:3321299-Pyramimonas_sp.AAC.1